MKSNSQSLNTWGRVRSARSRTMPMSGGANWIKNNPGKPILAYGSGRCYGDQSLNDGETTLLTRSAHQLHSLDEQTGEAIVDAGITFNQLSNILHARNFTYPVSAANGSVTIGGAIANDIHSKNHCNKGSFGKHVNWLDLMLSDGSIMRTSRTEEPDIFRATVGGMGLTGIIVKASVRMLKIPSRSVSVRYQRKPNLDAFLNELEDTDNLPPFWFGWIDALAEGAAMGRGILETGQIAQSDEGCLPMPKSKLIPFPLPALFTRPAIASRLNRRNFEAIPAEGVQMIKPLEAFNFPLDHIRGFNKIYGRRGFYSIHCGIPAGNYAGVRALLEEVVRARAGSLATAIKPMGGLGDGFLSFPMKGIALAFDMPNRPGVVELHNRLERITLDHGGRLYAAKDALMSAEGFARMFPQIPAFRSVLERIDPHGVFQSDLSRRLNIRGD